MNKFYRGIFNEYKKREFPLSLLGKYGGYMTFESVEELKKFYEGLSRAESQEKKNGVSSLGDNLRLKPKYQKILEGSD